METLEYDHNLFSQQESEADKLLAVRFFIMAIRNEERSIVEGRPIFDDTEMIEIRVRGDRNNIVIHPVREDEKRRFRRAYEDFKAGRSSAVVGTPLGEWPAMSMSTVEEMRYLGFYTVEQLADAPDAVCSKVPGLITLRNKAKVFMEYAKGSAPLEQLDAKVQSLTSALEVAQRAIEEQSRSYEELRAKHEKLLEKLADEA